MEEDLGSYWHFLYYIARYLETYILDSPNWSAAKVVARQNLMTQRLLGYLKLALRFSSHVKVDQEKISFCISSRSFGFDVDDTPKYTAHPKARDGI